MTSLLSTSCLLTSTYPRSMGNTKEPRQYEDDQGSEGREPSGLLENIIVLCRAVTSRYIGGNEWEKN